MISHAVHVLTTHAKYVQILVSSKMYPMHNGRVHEGFIIATYVLGSFLNDFSGPAMLPYFKCEQRRSAATFQISRQLLRLHCQRHDPCDFNGLHASACTQEKSLDI